MVGFKPDNQVHLSSIEYGTAGAFGGFVGRIVGQPLDVLKIRFQLQVNPISKTSDSSKYRSIIQAVRTIIAEEGVTALWKGHITAQMLSIVFGIAQFTSYEILTKKYFEVTHKDGNLNHFLCGSIAGCIGTISAHPFDVLRTRFVAQGEPKVYHGIREACVTMATKEGIFAFYKGLWPTLLQIAPQTGLQFGFFSICSRAWKVFFHREDQTLGASGSMVSGVISGIGAKIIIYPLDMIKKRLQIQGFDEATRSQYGPVRPYKGMLRSLANISRDEGLLALYKGLSPSLLKAGLITGVYFCAYDQFCNLLRQRHTK